ncbi:prolyl oligopeptidase family serine peptidase [Winogradskyella vidalii]|uniref:prolyl oligopeptidase family serine peptidase n=1 Tax=Winogradskyella vidalii TaxID=2615024 RepID=UPI0015CE64ED|nr:prolyl oligopeptidase family serine peptidase [Winogradskyella vidalii]
MLFIIATFAQAQHQNQPANNTLPETVTGTIVDKTDGTPLPYAYLKIDKVGLGTVTDGDGKFQITIPKKFDTYTITLSYLGFQDLNLSVTNFKAKNKHVFGMTPEAVSLDEVLVEKQKKLPSAKSILRKAIKNIPDNYTSNPILLTGYYRETMKENGVYIKYTDAVGEYYEAPYRKKKYKWRDYQSPYDFSMSVGTFSFSDNALHRIHFHHQTLKDEQVNIINSRSSSNLSKRNFNANIQGGPLGLFARNRVKYQQSFLGKKATRDFDYTVSEELDSATGNWLYVLEFHTKTTKADLDDLASPNPRNRRQWLKANNRKLLKGKIYINQTDLAIVRYECVVPNQLKEYFCGYKFNQVKHFDFKLDVRFKKKGHLYYIDNLRHEDEFIYKDSISLATTYYSAISEFKTTAITTENVKKFSKDDNFANTSSNQLYEYPLDYDTKFWTNYSTTNPISTIDTIIRSDMEFEKTLETQFRDKHLRNDTMPAPIAKIEPYSFKIHGETYTDNYAWLKDTKAPKNNEPVMDYLRQENNFTDNYTIPLKKAQRNLYKLLVSKVEKNTSSLPVERNGYSYYVTYSEEDEYPIYYRKAIANDTLPEELLNVNELAKERDYYKASLGAVSPDNQRVAVYENTTGTDEYTLKIKDLTNRAFLTDSITGVGSMTWLDNNTFLYVDIEKGTYRASKIMRHVLGTDAKTDAVIYEEKDPMFSVSIQKSKSKDYIFLSASSSTSSEIWYLKTADPMGDFKVIQPREKDHLYGVAHYQDLFYIVTNKNALNYKIATVPVADLSKGKWTDIIPHQKGVLIQGLQVFDNYLVINEKEDAQSRLKIINQTTQKSHVIKLKEDFYNISLGYNPDFATDSLQFSYSSFETPLTTYKYHMGTKKKRLVKQHSKPLGIPYFKYVVERKWVTAKDGQRIPLTLIRNKYNSNKNNNHKVYLTSYGSYGSGQSIPNGPTVYHLVNAGYVYAIAHIRGGDDMGNEWYEDGKLFNKKNTFSDFIACADYLIAENYAKPGSIVAQGGSAGGLLMGAVVNERPELFNTVILDVPFVDVINTMLDEKLPLTVGEFEEWGNPKIKKDYNYIKSYSPYDNVKAQNYPHLLFFTGLNDTRVGYWEPAKMVAKLRATKTDDNVLLLQTDFSNGHSGGSGRFAGFRDSAYKLALIFEFEQLSKRSE